MAIIEPTPLSWRRYVVIFLRMHKYSTLRSLTYEAVFSRSFSGCVLDFGGGACVNYRDRLLARISNGRLDSVNISREVQPTHLINIDAALPFDGFSYDYILSFNTLEHVYEVDFYLSEFARVLKIGGGVLISVPFLFRIHGSPDDFSRFTASWWEKKLLSLGFKDIVILPLVWDPLVTGLSLVEKPSSMLWKIVRAIVPLYSLFKCNFVIMFQSVLNRRQAGRSGSSYPVGYVISAVKQ